MTKEATGICHPPFIGIEKTNGYDKQIVQKDNIRDLNPNYAIFDNHGILMNDDTKKLPFLMNQSFIEAKFADAPADKKIRYLGFLADTCLTETYFNDEYKKDLFQLSRTILDKICEIGKKLADNNKRLEEELANISFENRVFQHKFDAIGKIITSQDGLPSLDGDRILGPNQPSLIGGKPFSNQGH